MTASPPLPETTLAHLLDDHALAQQQGRQTLVLTVNNRQARHLVATLSARLRADAGSGAGFAAGSAVIALPDIVPFAAWVQRLIGQLAFVADAANHPALAAHRVDGFGSLLLWQTVINELETEHYLLNTPQAARLAREADQLISNWLLTVPPAAQTPDWRRFSLWRKAYRARLAALDAQDDTLGLEQVCASLAGAADASGDDTPRLAARLATFGLEGRTVVLAGFNEIPPRLWLILKACQAAGNRVLRLGQAQHTQAAQAQERPPPPSTLRRVCAASPQQEWQWAVQWAHQQLQQQPQGRFAIIAPQLEKQLAFAHRLLHGRFDAQAATHTTPQAQLWNIALARPLSDWPIARAALAWLQLMAQTSQGRCTPALAGAALLGGHCAAHGAEAHARARLDAQWRHAGVLHLSADDFMQALQGKTPHLAAAWAQALAHLARLTQQNNAPTDIQAWTAHIKTLLSLLGFPGPGTLDSTRHQVLQALERALDALGRQQVVLKDITFAQAVQTLQQLLAQTGFQPQRSADARLDVLGMLEAQGGRWDAVWVLGLTDTELPSPPKPNPFIPLAVQRQAATPRATPERELQWAHESWRMLTQCAPQVTVSCAAFEGECELRPSPFIATLPVQTQAGVGNAADTAITPPACMECVRDDQGPALAAPPAAHEVPANGHAGEAVPGGVAVLEAQSRNPLWAFVKYRLHARQLPAYTRDLASGQHLLRGNFLHACAELFCTQVRSQQTLLQMVQTQTLAAVLTQQIGQAAQRHLRHYPAALRRLECERALDVLLNWAQLESERSPFEVVALEHSQRWTHGGVCLNLKLDRIDRLASGATLIIDYKTGMGTLRPQRDWLRRPPVNLQLPLYAATLNTPDNTQQDNHATPVAALVLMRLHARKVQALGLGSSAAALAALNGVVPLEDCTTHTGQSGSWAALLDNWRADIEALADDYARGWAANLTRQPDDLQYCDVLPLLRPFEIGFEAGFETGFDTNAQTHIKQGGQP